jgi:hypothetical protein
MQVHALPLATNATPLARPSTGPNFGNTDLALLTHAAEYGLGIGAGVATGFTVINAVSLHLKRFFHHVFNVGKPAVAKVAQTLEPAVAKVADTLEAVG